jgi:predicted TPR repeat methyltransferase
VTVGADLPGQVMEPSKSPTRELTLEEAVSFAILLQKSEQFGAAHELYRRVLGIAPDHPRALHYAGVLAHQRGRNDEALALIERSIALAPDQADWWSNRGIVLQSGNRLDSAIASYRRAIAIDPSHANAHNNLGVLLRATGQPAEAEASYCAAIRLNPEHIDAYTNLGILLNGLKRTEEAAACYCKVITLRPKHRGARKMLALAHSTLGQIDEAVKIYKEWLEEEPGDPIARHMLAACTGRDVPERAANDFVEATFDSFALTFESKLERLSYRAPVLVAATLEDSDLEPSHRLDVLDAGCGTGLCGAMVAPFARWLVGVDLSERMLAHAKDKNVYHALIRAELTEYLRNNCEAFERAASKWAFCVHARARSRGQRR